MIQLPAYVLVLVLLAASASCLIAGLAGAWVYHVGRAGKSPIPAPPAALSRVLLRKPADDEPKPAENGRRPPPLMKP